MMNLLSRRRLQRPRELVALELLELYKIQVPVNILDLFQISHNLSKAFRKLPTCVNVKKSKGKTVAAAVELAQIDALDP
jgi:hypothetical protein